MDAREDTQEAIEEQNPNEAATNTSQNESLRTERAPHEVQRHKNGDKSARTSEELTGTQEHEARTTRERKINDTSAESRD